MPIAYCHTQMVFWFHFLAWHAARNEMSKQ